MGALGFECEIKLTIRQVALRKLPSKHSYHRSHPLHLSKEQVTTIRTC